MKVLVVDDHEGLREMVAEVVRDAGHNVRTAWSGAAAMQILQHRSIDRVITDYDLGDCTGEDVAKFAKNINPSIRVLLMSGRTQEPRHADVFVLKPFNIYSIQHFLELQYS